MLDDSAETQDYVSCQGMEVDDDKSLEELDFVPRAVGEPPRVQSTCDKKCDAMGSGFPVDGQGGVTLSHVCPLCHCFPLCIW